MKKNKLYMRWSKKDHDLKIAYPASCDGHLVHGVFCMHRPYNDVSNGMRIAFDKPFVDELESRGYDITTLKFSIEKKKQP